MNKRDSTTSEPTTSDIPNLFKDDLYNLPGKVVSDLPSDIVELPNKLVTTALDAQNAFLDNILFALSVLLIIPLFISYKYQSRLVSMILASAIFYINMYHYSHEQNFAFMDFVWSSILTFTNLIILYLGYKKYGATPRIVGGWLIGTIALYIYIFNGYFPDDVKDPRSVNGYLKNHALWHILGFISLCIIMTIKVDISKILDH